MKKIFVSVGLVAAGAAGFHNAYADGLDVVSPKAWNVSATLRGFYDDNYAVSSLKKGSGGIEFSPQLSLNVPLQQTDLGLRYIYGLYYYEQRDELGVNAFDQTHQFDLWLDHSFNERWRAKFTDSFAIGQEPALLDPRNNSVPYRVEGNNIANHALITLNTDWTRLFSTAVHYSNNFYDYDGDQSALKNLPGTQPGVYSLPATASLAGLLNRIEQSAGIDLQWHVQPTTVVFIGYNFSLANYIGDEAIAAYFMPSTLNTLIYKSDSRDAMTHYGYLGVTHEFTANLSGTARGGLSYTDSYNDPLNHSTSLAPYADLSLSYTYIPGSYIQVGFTHDINATDVASVGTDGSLTQYQESSVVYASINHRFTSKLLATGVARYQYSTYQGGANSSAGDSTYSLGANLNYQFTRHFSAEVGYNYDHLESDLAGRGYDRNRVYIGLGANY